MIAQSSASAAPRRGLFGTSGDGLPAVTWLLLCVVAVLVVLSISPPGKCTEESSASGEAACRDELDHCSLCTVAVGGFTIAVHHDAGQGGRTM